MKRILILLASTFMMSFGVQAKSDWLPETFEQFFVYEEITIKIKMPNGNTFDLKVNTADEVSEVMLLIEEKEGLLMQDYMATFEAVIMPDGYALSAFGIKNQSIVEVVSKEQPEMEILVKMLTGRSFTFEMTAYQTIADLKEAIESEEGVPTDKQRLIFAGKELEDKKTLRYYNIKEESTIHLVIRG